MENLLPLLEMGFEMSHLERAYMCGCRTVEDAVAYLADDLSGSSTEISPGRLVLRIPNADAACTSIFTPTRPFHVNLMDQHVAPVEKSDWTLNESGSSQSPVMSGYEKLDEAFAFQQAEAHKSAAEMKSDRIARLRERELLLAEIRAEKESRRWRQPIYNPPNTIDESVTSTPVASQTHDMKMASDQLRIRVFPIGSSTDPILLVLPRSAIYADLLTAVQQSVLSNYPLLTNSDADSGSSNITHLDQHLRSLQVFPIGSSTDPILLVLPRSAIYADLLTAVQQSVLSNYPLLTNSDADSGSSNITHLDQHLRSLQVTDKCVQLIVNTWPRQTLPHCSSLSPSSSSAVTQSDLYLTQSLLDLGLIDGISVHVRHCGSCAFGDDLNIIKNSSEDSVAIPTERNDLSANSKSAPSDGNLRDETVKKPCDVSDPFRIRVFRIDRSTDPVLLTFPRSAVYADLLTAVQQYVLSNRSPNVGANFRSVDNARMEQHLCSLHVTDECVQLIVSTWPRRTLPHCSSLSPSSMAQSDRCLTWPLTDLGLSDGISLHVRHCARCPFQDNVELVENLPENPSDDPIRNGDLPMDHANTLDPRFPSGGEQLVPQPPDGIIPRSRLTIQENIRRAVSRLESEFERSTNKTDTELPPSSWFTPTRLTVLCLRRVLELITRYLDAITSSRIGRNLPATKDALNCWVINTLNNLPNLRVLRVSQTRVTDAGWIQASHVPTSDTRRPLLTLEASGLHTQLTHQGLEAIVNLFPQLRRLNVAASNLHLSESSTKNVLNSLTHLDVSDCDQLECLPSCLIPPRSGYNHSQGLATVRIHRCTRLNLAIVLDQLQAQPIKCMDGLETLQCLDGSLLVRYCSELFRFCYFSCVINDTVDVLNFTVQTLDFNRENEELHKIESLRVCYVYQIGQSIKVYLFRSHDACLLVFRPTTSD
ncbi:hypothetical protein AHF37_04783 [Paragonimus kellicotti]|nr:hypothetical protein AHF37_04783 [Paragonimus kellicotti]